MFCLPIPRLAKTRRVHPEARGRPRLPLFPREGEVAKLDQRGTNLKVALTNMPSVGKTTILILDLLLLFFRLEIELTYNHTQVNI